MIAAIGKNRELGNGNDLLWKIPEDLKHFKETTKGHSIIMGRKTFESIGKALPNRTNIVITRDSKWAAPDAFPVVSIEEALELSKTKPGKEEVFIIGGGQIYELGLPYADRLYLTLIDAEKPADCFFPAYEHSFKKKMLMGEGEFEGTKYTWMNFDR